MTSQLGIIEKFKTIILIENDGGKLDWNMEISMQVQNWMLVTQFHEWKESRNLFKKLSECEKNCAK